MLTSSLGPYGGGTVDSAAFHVDDAFLELAVVEPTVDVAIAVDRDSLPGKVEEADFLSAYI
jgi:hypothetical protein